MCGTHTAYHATRMLCDARGTERACDGTAVRLRTCVACAAAMRGTASYAMSGTDIAAYVRTELPYAAMPRAQY
eukprot:2718563-Rhodomonas_salina.3